MNGKFCDKLNNMISFFHFGVIPCCFPSNIPIYYNCYDNKFDETSLILHKTNFLTKFMQGNVEYKQCKCCSDLRPLSPSDKINQKYNYINISHWVHCNCGCVYCSRFSTPNKNIENKIRKSNYYDFLPILERLYKNNLIDRENAIFCFQGGDISLLKEFANIVKCITKNGYKEIFILTNNIIYQPIIKKLIDEDKHRIMITASLDAGTRETYKKIKRVDKFDVFISNLKKYIHKIDNPNIKIQYIIVKDYNDNLEELTKFIILMKDVGIVQLELSIDFRIFNNNLKDKKFLPPIYKKMYLLFLDLCNQFSIAPYIQEHNKYYFLNCVIDS